MSLLKLSFQRVISVAHDAVEEMLRSVTAMSGSSFWTKNEVCFIQIIREEACLTSFTNQQSGLWRRADLGSKLGATTLKLVSWLWANDLTP